MHGLGQAGCRGKARQGKATALIYPDTEPAAHKGKGRRQRWSQWGWRGCGGVDVKKQMMGNWNEIGAAADYVNKHHTAGAASGLVPNARHLAAGTNLFSRFQQSS
jgi:hypothetical protein